MYTNNTTFLGLPRKIAFYYLLMFSLSMILYLHLWPNAPIIEADSPGYMEVAQDLEDFRIDQPHLRTPGYPLLLLFTGSSRTPTRIFFIVSLLLHFASIWFLACILYLHGLKRNIVILFGIILLLPLYVERAGYVLTETLCQFTLVLGFAGIIFYIIYRKIRWLWISSIAIAYSGLTRPTYQILALAIITFLFIIPRLTDISKKEIIKANVILLISSVLLIGGYSLMNYLKFGYFGITYALGFHLTTRTIRYMERLPEKYAIVRDILIKHRNAHLVKTHSSHTGYMAIWSAIPDLKKATGFSDPELSYYLLHINLFLIRKAPLNYLREVFLALASYCLPAVTKELASMNSRIIQMIWVTIHFLIFGVFIIIVTGLSGIFLYVICRKLFLNKHIIIHEPLLDLHIISFTLSMIIIVYTAIITCLIEEGEPHTRVPTDMLIMFTIFLGIHLWFFLLHHPFIITGERHLTQFESEVKMT